MVPMETLDAVSYSTSIEVMAVSSAVSTQFTNVTDGQTLHDGTGGVYAWHRAEKKQNSLCSCGTAMRFREK